MANKMATLSFKGNFIKVSILLDRAMLINSGKVVIRELKYDVTVELFVVMSSLSH